MSAIPLADAPALRTAARLTFAVRATLAALAIGAAVAFLVVSRHPQTRTIVSLPNNASTIVVLDVSASISTDTYSRIGGTLASISHSGARIGLVVFSDTAYEMLPPGVPASDLAPFVRYFTLPKQTQAGAAPIFPPNPWTNTFTAGTRCSAGMELAHTIALAEPRRPTVVLISDLDDDPNDLAALASVMAAYDRDHIPVRVVGLNPSTQDVALFQRLVGPGVPIVQAPTLDEVPPRDVTAFPAALLALTLVAALALAVRELWSPRLEWSAT
jgi:pimeloyl-ACP methyl ester carboxylesterase